MDFVAKYFLAFLVSQNLGLDPTITWFFNAHGCSVCVTHQLDLMKRYYREGDPIIVHLEEAPKNGKQTGWVQRQIDFWNPNVSIELSTKPRFGVGWVFWDNLTGERITVVNGGGQYNRWRAQEILKLIR